MLPSSLNSKKKSLIGVHRFRMHSAHSVSSARFDPHSPLFPSNLVSALRTRSFLPRRKAMSAFNPLTSRVPDPACPDSNELTCDGMFVIIDR